nr:NAD(P) transhydrogenase subunit alpha [Pseudofrankia sp. DC12]
MSTAIESGLYVFLLASFVGFEVIRRVPPLFHTPLMSLTNAVAGISLVGSLVIAGSGKGAVSTLLGTIAVTASTINVVGGFLITDRMLKMFRPRGAAKEAPAGGPSAWDWLRARFSRTADPAAIPSTAVTGEAGR